MTQSGVSTFQTKIQLPRKQGTGFNPVLFPIMKNRRVMFILILLAGLQIGTTLYGFGIWKCPIYTTLGIQCPGCGVSTALSLLIQGKWELVMQTHAFAPILLAGFILITAINLLPGKAYNKMLHRIYFLEKKSGFVQWLFAGMFLYWIIRISGMI